MGEILIVEGNKDAGRALFLMVEDLGYKPFLVTNGKAAVLAVGKIRPKVVLMEIALPDIDGCEAVRRIRVEHPDAMPGIIAVTALGRPEDVARTTAAGMKFHLVKPVRVELLRSALESLANPLQ